MSDVDPRISAHFDQMAEERIQLEAERKVLSAKFDRESMALSSQYAKQLEPLEQRINALNNQLRTDLQAARSTLIKKGKESFMTPAARFQLRHPTTPSKVLDEKAIMKSCRKLRIISNVADPPRRTWKFNRKKFFEWLEKNPAYLGVFKNHIRKATKHETLMLYPNAARAVFLYDGERVTIDPIDIYDVEIESPDSIPEKS